MLIQTSKNLDISKQKSNEVTVYAAAFLAVLLLQKNAPATAPNIAAKIPINITVSLTLPPNIAVPDP